MARWSNQLPGEMTANLFFKRYYRLRGLEKRYSSGFETDALAYWHADAGTVKVQAGGGMSFRFGYNLGNTSPENSIRGATSARAALRLQQDERRQLGVLRLSSRRRARRSP